MRPSGAARGGSVMERGGRAQPGFWVRVLLCGRGADARSSVFTTIALVSYQYRWIDVYKSSSRVLAT